MRNLTYLKNEERIKLRKAASAARPKKTKRNQRLT